MVSFAGDGKERPRTLGMAEALRALELELRKPGPEDVPPPSTFPLTRAAKAALELTRRKRRTPDKRRPQTPAELGHEVTPWPANPHGSEEVSENGGGAA